MPAPARTQVEITLDAAGTLAAGLVGHGGDPSPRREHPPALVPIESVLEADGDGPPCTRSRATASTPCGARVTVAFIDGRAGGDRRRAATARRRVVTDGAAYLRRRRGRDG